MNSQVPQGPYFALCYSAHDKEKCTLNEEIEYPKSLNDTLNYMYNDGYDLVTASCIPGNDEKHEWHILYFKKRDAK